MWLRRGIQIGREADTLEAARRVAGFTDVTTTERDLLEHGVKLGEASKTTPSRADWSEESIDRIYRERIQEQSLKVDLPSGKRMWELSERAIEIERDANRSSSLSYGLYELEVNEQADRAMRGTGGNKSEITLFNIPMDPVEQRFLATCLAGLYVPPEQRGQDWKREYEPAYFVSLEPIQGDTISYGPFSVAEAYERFEATYPDFDGGSVALIKVESSIPGVSPSDLRRNALSEEYEQGDPEEKKWMELYDKSSSVVGRDVWDSKWEHGEVTWSHKGKEYEPSFVEELEREHGRGSDQNEIESIYASEWHQGFGSECKEHLGKGNDGYYYALEMESDDDLSWNGPYSTREEAEERLSEAWERWDERTGEREQAWEDQEIARLEKEEQREIEQECDRQIEREIEASRVLEKAYEMEM
jgi:hypothetical protein